MRRHPWLVASLLALTGVVVLGSFPARAYLDQVGQRQDLEGRVAALDAANAQLAEKAAYLGTDEAVERLARERYQLVRPGEEAYAILPTGEAAAASPPPAPSPAPAEVAEPETSWWGRVWAGITSIF